VLPNHQPIETHWSRILHCDIFNADEEIFMAPEDTRDNEHSRTPTESALVLLAIYVALYLGVAGLVHILTLPHANAAVAPSVATAPASVAPPSSFPVSALESAAKEATERTTEYVEDPRECKQGNPFDSNCIFD
jgi:hypothetical protein